MMDVPIFIKYESIDIPEAKSDIPEVKSDIPEAKSDIPEVKSDIPEVKSDIPEAKSDIPEAKSDIPEAKSDIPEATRDTKGLALDDHRSTTHALLQAALCHPERGTTCCAAPEERNGCMTVARYAGSMNGRPIPPAEAAMALT